MAIPVSNCRLLSGWFADLIQLTLALVAILVLLFKRYLEKPKRPWTIWAMDVGKQGFGAAFAHGLNLILAEILAGHSSLTDQCAWYLINFTADTVIGVVFSWIFLRALEKFAVKYHWRYFEVSGQYGDPPDKWAWLAQLVSWLLITLLTKIILASCMYALLTPMETVGDWFSSLFVSSPQLELVLVMLVGPYALNTVQFWITDAFLKSEGGRRKVSHESLDRAEAATLDVLDDSARLPLLPRSATELLPPGDNVEES